CCLGTVHNALYTPSLRDALPIWGYASRLPRRCRVVRVAVVGCGAMGSIYAARIADAGHEVLAIHRGEEHVVAMNRDGLVVVGPEDRKSTRLNSSHVSISYAVFCL